MNPNPLDRISTPPLTIPGAVGMTQGNEPGRIVPAYLVEEEGRDFQDEESASTTASELHFNNGTISIDIDATGIVLTNLSSGDSVSILADGSFVIADASSGNEAVIYPSDMFYGNYAMNEFVVCNSGTPEYRRIFSSEGYPI